MDSQERAYVRGGQSAVRTAFGVITNYAKDPSFEGAGTPQVMMRNIAAYGSFETAQSGTTEVRRNLHVDPLFSSNRVSAVNGATVVGHSSEYSFGRGRGARVTTPVGGTIDSGVSIGGSAFTGTPSTAYTMSIAIRAITATSLSTYTSGFNSPRGTLTLAAGEVGRIRLTLTTNASGGGSGTWYILRTDNTVGSTFDIGEPLIEQTDQLRPYFDGSSPNEKGFTTEWAGTANASASIMRAATVTARENLARDPRGISPSRWIATGSSPSTPIAVTDMPGDVNTGVQSTQGGSGASLLGLDVAPIPTGTQITVRMTIRTSVALTTVSINYRPIGTTSGESSAAVSNLPAGTSEIVGTMTTSTTAATSASFVGARWAGAAGATITITKMIVEVGPSAVYFDGTTPNSGDFINAWSGSANASTSVQQAVSLHPSTGSQASGNAYYSWDWTSVGGSMRYFPTSSSGTNSYYNPSVSNRLASGVQYTAVVRLRITAPSAGYRALELRTNTGAIVATSGQAPNEPGEYILRVIFTPTANNNYMRMETRGDAGWSSWWADLTVVEGNYPNLMPFDGSSTAQAPYYYAWEGTPFASDSIYAAPGVSNITGGAQVNRPNGSKALLVGKGETATLNAAYFGMPSIVGFSSVISLEVAPYYNAGGGIQAPQIDAGTLLGRLTMDNGDVVELRNDEAIVAFATASGSNNSTQRVGWTMSIPSNRSVSSFQLMAPSNGNYSGILFDRLLVSRLQPQLL